MKSFLSGWFLLFSLCSAINLQAQTVNEKFDKLIYSENFDSIKTDWPVISNAENLMLVQNGEYILSRKTNLSPFAIVSTNNFSYKGFKIETSLKLDKGTSAESSIGLMFMIQPNNAGAWMLEFNMNKEYRLRKMSGSKFVLFTGNEKSQGWVKNNSINDPTVPTLIEIVYAHGNFDFYFNKELVNSFSDKEFESGNIGFSIGPLTKGRIDFLHFYSSTNYSPDQAIKNPSKPEGDMSTLVESIIIMKTQVNSLTEENDLLKHTIDAMKSESQNGEGEKKLMQQKLAAHDAEMLKAQKHYDSLLMINATLEKYREIVEGNENSDLIITLSKSLKSEMEKNKQLTDSIKTLQKNYAPKQASPDNKQGAIPNQNAQQSQAVKQPAALKPATTGTTKGGTTKSNTSPK